MGIDAQETGLSFDISTITIWGLVECPADLIGIYTGRAGTSYHNNAGAGANIVCMNDEYTSDTTPERRSTSFASIFGVEYRTIENGDPLGQQTEENLPCAVCNLVSSAVYMQPGSTTCPMGWSPVYQGFIMSELGRLSGSNRNNENYRSEFVCVHEDGEGVDGLSAPSPEAQIGHVHVDCANTNILPCNPPPPISYSAGQLSCIVCSKDLV